MRCGRWLGRVTVLLVLGASPAFPARLLGEQGVPGTPAAEIELRKSFRSPSRTSRQISRAGQRDGTGRPEAAAAADPDGSARLQLAAAAAAIGESLQVAGTLHLPGVGGTGLVLREETTPVLATVSGRRLILDPDRTIPPETAAAVARLWPDFLVVQPPAGAGLRELIGGVLDAAGYDSVLRAAPLTFGRGVTVRFVPDFLVQRGEPDLLAGEVRAISVVSPEEALPAELRELAGEHRVQVVELTAAGSPAGSDRARWRDPSGRVTTMESFRPKLLLEEIALGLGLSVERVAGLPGAAAAATPRGDLRIGRSGEEALVRISDAPVADGPAASPGETAIALRGAPDLQQAIGTLLERFGIPAIGPIVEFYRSPRPGGTPRFVISVPGWLAQSGGRRLLITGAAPPPAVRLFLARADIDIFEYRVSGGR